MHKKSSPSPTVQREENIEDSSRMQQSVNRLISEGFYSYDEEEDEEKATISQGFHLQQEAQSSNFSPEDRAFLPPPVT